MYTSRQHISRVRRANMSSRNIVCQLLGLSTIYKRQSQPVVVTCAEILNLQMNKDNGFFALRMEDTQRIIRWRIFNELLFTFAADVLLQDMLHRQFGFLRRPLLYHWSVALALLCLNKWSGNSDAFCQSFVDGSFRVDTCALPCRVVRQ